MGPSVPKFSTIAWALWVVKISEGARRTPCNWNTATESVCDWCIDGKVCELKEFDVSLVVEHRDCMFTIT